MYLDPQHWFAIDIDLQRYLRNRVAYIQVKFVIWVTEWPTIEEPKWRLKFFDTISLINIQPMDNSDDEKTTWYKFEFCRL